ncbi:MAG: zinc-ribbon domain-containing protein [Gaiellaceae bacterium]
MSESCPSCDAALPEGSRFCPECGSRVVEVAEEPRYFGVPPTPSAPQWLDAIVDRAEAAVESIQTRTRGARELGRFRRELDELRELRTLRLQELGEAVYRGDDGARKIVNSQLQGLDERIRRKEEEMAATQERTSERVDAAKPPVQETVRLETPAPERIPEPASPPDKGTPPESARVPEQTPG